MSRISITAACALPLALLFAGPACADAASETVTAATHAELAAGASDLNGMHTHLHHALNCLVGPGGNGFDAKEMNPCAQSGHGAIPDTDDVRKKVSLEAAADKARSGIAATDMKTARARASAVAAALKAGK